MRRLALLYNRPAEDADLDEADVLVQVASITQALAASAEVIPIGVTLDLAALDRKLQRIKPDVVFNLVEALGETDRLASLVPQLLDARGIPYTGAGSAAQLSLIDKVAFKLRLRAAGLPTPDWYLGAENTFPGAGC